MKIKKEIIILVLIIIALALYLSFRSRDRTHYQLPELEEITGNEISKIELIKKGGTLLLGRDGDTWKVMPYDYLAAGYVIDNILEIIENLSLTTLISESGNYDRYGLDDDNKITVKAWAGDDIKREFDIGKVHEPSNHTFVRLAGNPRVYHAREEFRWKFDQTLDSIRDKAVLEFDKEEIREFSITRDGKSHNFTRTERIEEKDQSAAEKPLEPQTVWRDSKGMILENDKVNSFLKIMSELSCETYIEGMEISDFKDPVITVLLKGKKDYTVSVFAKQDENDQFYPSVSSESKYPFYLPDWAEEEIFKSPEDMFNKQEDSDAD